MKLLLIAPYCFGLETSLASAFLAQGCDVCAIFYGKHDDKPAAEQAMHRHPALVRGLKRALDSVGLLRPLLNRRLGPFNAKVIRAAREFRPDAVLIVKGETLFPETVAELKKGGTLASYHWDDPFLSHVQAADGTKDPRFANLRAAVPLFDVTFVYDPAHVEPLRKAGSRDPQFLMHWYEPEVFKPLTLPNDERARFAADVAFVGSPYPNRIELLRSLSSFDVALWGPRFRWEPLFAAHPFLRKQYRGEATGAEAVKIYNASAVSLNIHDNFQCVASFNNRTLQIMASGGLLLVDDRPMIRATFQVGEDLDTYRTTGEAAEKIRYYLANLAAARRIRHNAPQAAAPHSAVDRARLMLDAIRSAAARK